MDTDILTIYISKLQIDYSIHILVLFYILHYTAIRRYNASEMYTCLRNLIKVRILHKTSICACSVCDIFQVKLILKCCF